MYFILLVLIVCGAYASFGLYSTFPRVMITLCILAAPFAVDQSVAHALQYRSGDDKIYAAISVFSIGVYYGVIAIAIFLKHRIDALEENISSIKNIWICACGQLNPENIRVCVRCKAQHPDDICPRISESARNPEAVACSEKARKTRPISEEDVEQWMSIFVLETSSMLMERYASRCADDSNPELVEAARRILISRNVLLTQ